MLKLEIAITQKPADWFLTLYYSVSAPDDIPEYLMDKSCNILTLAEAHSKGIKTWVSFEPVTNERQFFIELHLVSLMVDMVKIGKLNYHPSSIDWKSFGEKAEALCKSLGIDYYIKDGLREEMNK